MTLNILVLRSFYLIKKNLWNIWVFGQVFDKNYKIVTEFLRRNKQLTL